MPGPRVLIVEDHAILSHALSGALSNAGCSRVDVQGADELAGDSVLAAVKRLRPDVVLLDLDLGDGRSGVPLVAPIGELRSIVLILTANEDEAVSGEALDEGAVGVLYKSQPFQELVEAVCAAAEGKRVMSPARRQEMIDAWRRRRRAQGEHSARFARLTSSEAAVLEALVEGCSLEVIASQRGVAVGTVRSQVKALLRKLQVGSQLAAVALAREAGWPAG